MNFHYSSYSSSAYLFWGNKGLGQYQFVEKLSAWLLCENVNHDSKNSENYQACGQCASCQWLSASTHPDRLILSPESGSSSIKIDAIRAIQAFSEQKSHGGRCRVIIISPAEAMNVSAANALLKILEEPFEKSIFLLVSYHFSSLLPTILSRCQKIYFPPLDQEAFQKILLEQQCPPEIMADLYKLSHGSPWAFETLKEKQEIIELKKKLFSLMNGLRAKTLNPMEIIEAVETLKNVNLENMVDILINYAHQWSIRKKDPKVYIFYDKLLDMKRYLKKNINVNQTIWLEALFFQLVE